MCENKEGKGCKKTFFKVEVRYFSGSILYSGNVTDISKSCVCFNTKFCFPKHSMIKLQHRNNKTFDINISVKRSNYINNIHDLRVEVLNPSLDYINYVNSSKFA